MVIGCRPCGARGKLVFDPVYETDKIKDPYYLQRRNNTVFLTLTCDRPETTCFCHSVGGGPADPAGSRVNYLHFEIITIKIPVSLVTVISFSIKELLTPRRSVLYRVSLFSG